MQLLSVFQTSTVPQPIDPTQKRQNYRTHSITLLNLQPLAEGTAPPVNNAELLDMLPPHILDEPINNVSHKSTRPSSSLIDTPIYCLATLSNSPAATLLGFLSSVSGQCFISHSHFNIHPGSFDCSWVFKCSNAHVCMQSCPVAVPYSLPHIDTFCNCSVFNPGPSDFWPPFKCELLLSNLSFTLLNH